MSELTNPQNMLQRVAESAGITLDITPRADGVARVGTPGLVALAHAVQVTLYVKKSLVWPNSETMLMDEDDFRTMTAQVQRASVALALREQRYAAQAAALAVNTAKLEQIREVLSGTPCDDVRLEWDGRVSMIPDQMLALLESQK